MEHCSAWADEGMSHFVSRILLARRHSVAVSDKTEPSRCCLTKHYRCVPQLGAGRLEEMWSMDECIGDEALIGVPSENGQ